MWLWMFIPVHMYWPVTKSKVLSVKPILIGDTDTFGRLNLPFFVGYPLIFESYIPIPED